MKIECHPVFGKNSILGMWFIEFIVRFTTFGLVIQSQVLLVGPSPGYFDVSKRSFCDDLKISFCENGRDIITWNDGLNKWRSAIELRRLPPKFPTNYPAEIPSRSTAIASTGQDITARIGTSFGTVMAVLGKIAKRLSQEEETVIWCDLNWTVESKHR